MDIITNDFNTEAELDEMALIFSRRAFNEDELPREIVRTAQAIANE